MGTMAPMDVTWELKVKTRVGVPQSVIEAGEEAIEKYLLEQCELASATKTRVAGTFIVGQVHGDLAKRVDSAKRA